MPLTDEQYRAGAIAHINQLCGTLFVDGTLPIDIDVAVDLLIKAMKETNVASQKLGDMSKSFFEGSTYRAAIKYLKPYRRAGFK